MKELSDDIWDMEFCYLILDLLPTKLRFIRVLVFHSSKFAVSHVRYVSKNEREVYHQFLIFLVEYGACELVCNESEKGCQYKSSSYCMEGLQSYSTSMKLHGHY